MIDLLKKILGVHSPSRWGMTKKEWKQLEKDIIKRTDKAIAETAPIYCIGVDFAIGNDFTSPPSFLDKKLHIK